MQFGLANTENLLISQSMTEAERRIMDGSASDTLIIHFLKLGSTMAELERQRLIRETALLEARSKHFQSQTDGIVGYQEVMDAILNYRGSSSLETNYEELR